MDNRCLLLKYESELQKLKQELQEKNQILNQFRRAMKPGIDESEKLQQLEQ